MHNKKQAQVGVQRIIENRLETPIFFIVTAMLLVREAQPLSGNAFVLSRLLGRLFQPFMIVNGIGMAVGSAMLFTIAGRNWRNWRAEALDIVTRSSVSRLQRLALVAHARENVRISFVFMLLGALISVYNGVAFLISNNTSTRVTVGQYVADFAVAFIMLVVMAYIGVFRERHQVEETSALVMQIEGDLNDAVRQAIARFGRSQHTDSDVVLISQYIPPHKRSMFLSATRRAAKTRVWTSTQLREALGITANTPPARELNRQVNLLAQDTVNGVHKADNGRTWLIPHSTVMDRYGQDIARVELKREYEHGQHTDKTRTNVVAQT